MPAKRIRAMPILIGVLLLLVVGALPARIFFPAMFGLVEPVEPAGGAPKLLEPNGPERRPIRDLAQDPGDIEPVLLSANPGYVGIKICAECHRDRCAEFEETRHFVACVPASGAKAPGFDENGSTHQTLDKRLRFEMTRAGDELTAVGIESGPAGEERIPYRIGLVYGAGGSGDEMYFSWQGDYLYNLPVAWLYPHNGWGNAVESIRAREASAGCLECHNTWVAHVRGTVNEFNRSGMLMGVTCERCHGPGKEHAAYHRGHPQGPAQAIVLPSALPRERQLEICTQCHANLKPRDWAFSHRAGEPLDLSYRVVETKYPEDEQVANQIRYLRQSKCFQDSDLTCVTCHSPHRKQSPEEIHQACQKCHAAEACHEQPRLPAMVRSDCTGCHMPSRVWINVRFHTHDERYVPPAPRSDHRIAVHPEASQAVLLAWLRTRSDEESRERADRLSSQLTQHWVNESEQRQRDHRLTAAVAALREAVKINPDEPTRQKLQAAIDRLAAFDAAVVAGNECPPTDPRRKMDLMKKILAIKPNDSAALGELATAQMLLGDDAAAEKQLAAAALADAEDSYCLTALAALAYRRGQWDEASRRFEQADEVTPFDANTHFGWGLSLIQQKNWPEARTHFQLTLKIDPRHAPASRRLSEVLIHLGQFDEAVLHARRAVHFTSGRNAATLVTLADALQAANRPAEMRQILEQALASAREAEPELVPSIRARLAESP